jgi:NitT/TauT family transport system substrate-binding protein
VKHGLKLGEFTSIPVGSGDSFIRAMEQDTIQAGMTTEPTISRMLSAGTARILVDLRMPESSKLELGGNYPAVSFYLETHWIEQHRDVVQKLVNAFVKTLRYISTHSASDIAEYMPTEYFAGNKASYIAALEAGKGMFTPDGVMPPDGPETVYSVLAGFSKNVRGKKIDLSKTYTTEFVEAVK